MHNILKNRQMFPTWLHRFTVPPVMYESSNFSHLSFSVFLAGAILVGAKWYFIVVLICISQMNNDI
jgi:4-amino-4-deoxy-L-arabinose transferase-like glycosyltransferase